MVKYVFSDEKYGILTGAFAPVPNIYRQAELRPLS